MNDISELLRTLLDKYSRASEAEHEFRRMLEEDHNLREDYVEWCEGNGYETKTGFQDYLDELIDSRDSIWENLNE